MLAVATRLRLNEPGVHWRLARFLRRHLRAVGLLSHQRDANMAINIFTAILSMAMPASSGNNLSINLTRPFTSKIMCLTDAVPHQPASERGIRRSTAEREVVDPFVGVRTKSNHFARLAVRAKLLALRFEFKLVHRKQSTTSLSLSLAAKAITFSLSAKRQYSRPQSPITALMVSISSSVKNISLSGISDTRYKLCRKTFQQSKWPFLSSC